MSIPNESLGGTNPEHELRLKCGVILDALSLRLASANAVDKTVIKHRESIGHHYIQNKVNMVLASQRILLEPQGDVIDDIEKAFVYYPYPIKFKEDIGDRKFTAIDDPDTWRLVFIETVTVHGHRESSVVTPRYRLSFESEAELRARLDSFDDEADMGIILLDSLEEFSAAPAMTSEETHGLGTLESIARDYRVHIQVPDIPQRDRPAC